jgi:hypothetical protein
MTNESGGVFIGADKRGKHIPHNKTKDEDLQKVRQHTVLLNHFLLLKDITHEKHPIGNI